MNEENNDKRYAFLNPITGLYLCGAASVSMQLRAGGFDTRNHAKFLWKFHPLPGGAYRIENQHFNGHFLDLGDGTGMVNATLSSGDHETQRWRFLSNAKPELLYFRYHHCILRDSFFLCNDNHPASHLDGGDLDWIHATKVDDDQFVSRHKFFQWHILRCLDPNRPTLNKITGSV